MKGMVCDGCAQRVHEALLEVASVEAARVDLTTQEAGVLADTDRVTADRLVQAVHDADFAGLVPQAAFLVTSLGRHMPRGLFCV